MKEDKYKIRTLDDIPQDIYGKVSMSSVRNLGRRWLERHENMSMDTSLVEDAIRHIFNLEDE